MKNFLSLLALVFLITSAVNAQGIEFRDLSFDEALTAAKEEGKPIFMDCYTTWCGPCKWMSANIFTQEAVGNFYNENYICVKFDMEKGEGLELAKKYAVSAYPTLLFIRGDEELLHVQVGAPRNPKDYIEAAKLAKDPKRNMPYLSANKAENFDNPEFMAQYFKTFGAADRLEEGELDRYFSQFEVEEWTEDSQWEIISKNARDYESEVFQTVLENQELFEEAHGEKAELFMKQVVFNHLRMIYFYAQKQPDKIDFEEQRVQILDSKNFTHAEEVGFMLDLMIFEREKDWDQYCETCEDGVKEYYWDNAYQLNNIAWTVFENSKNPKNLEMALMWAERAAKLDGEKAYILDTYANLLFANGLTEKALKVEKEALQLAKKHGEDTESYQKVIDKIKASLKS